VPRAAGVPPADTFNHPRVERFGLTAFNKTLGTSASALRFSVFTKNKRRDVEAHRQRSHLSLAHQIRLIRPEMSLIQPP
jgi:hypothetical protein